MIVIDRISRQLGGVWVLRGVSLRVGAGELVALVGPSGAGKSVLLKHIIGLMQPDGGTVQVNGTPLSGITYESLSRLRRSMGYVFQDGALIDWLTVRENLLLAIPDAERRLHEGRAEEAVYEALRRVNLPSSVLEKHPSELSGGMRKRAGVARATLNAPQLVLYDEPTTGLDPQNVLAINECILAVRRDLGATSVVVTHDMGSVAHFADRVVMLAGGVVTFDGTVGQFFSCSSPSVMTFRGIAERLDDGDPSWRTTHVDVTR